MGKNYLTLAIEYGCDKVTYPPSLHLLRKVPLAFPDRKGGSIFLWVA